MIPFQSLFTSQRSSVIELDGQVYHQYLEIPGGQAIELNFEFISSSSKHIQGIVVCFPKDFKGNVFYAQKEIEIPKSAFPKLIFWEDSMPKCFSLNVISQCGSIEICNGSDPLGTKQVCKHLSGGCAMIIEKLSDKKVRLLCNDYEYDTNFDDLIFTVEIKGDNV